VRFDLLRKMAKEGLEEGAAAAAGTSAAEKPRPIIAAGPNVTADMAEPSARSNSSGGGGGVGGGSDGGSGAVVGVEGVANNAMTGRGGFKQYRFFVPCLQGDPHWGGF
jgi:hypothetical protein